MTRNTTPVCETEKYKIIYVDNLADDGSLIDCFFEVQSVDEKCLGKFPTLDAAQDFASTL